MKHKAKVWYLSFINDIVKIVGHQKIKVNAKKVSFNKSSYMLDINKGIELKKNRFHYFVDILIGQVFLSQQTSLNVISADVLDEFVSTNIIKQMIAAVRPGGWTEKIILLALGVMAGCGLGFTLAGYI